MIKKIALTGVLALGLTASLPSVAFDLSKAIGAAGSVFQAATLTDGQVKAYATQMALQSDKTNSVAPASSAYGKRLARIIKGWQNTDGLKLNFKVYQNKEVNAFAMADGTVRLNTGLLDMMTDDEVRFVLGHEIGHVKLGHSKSQLTKSLLTSAVIQGAASTSGSVGQLADGQLGGLLEQFANAQFSQSDESAADAYGLQLLTAKKVNPQAAVSALDKLASLGDSGGLMSSHPSSKKRADNIRKQIGKM